METITYLALTGSSTLDKFIETPLKAVGVLVVLYAIFKSFQDIIAGKTGEAIRRILIFAAVAAILFNPDIIPSLITGVGAAVKALVTGIGEILGGGSGTTPTAPSGTP